MSRTILIVAFLSMVTAGCFGPPSVEQRPKKYSSLLKDWRATGLVNHFPNQFPATATNIKLSVFPGYLQGGAFFQVRMSLPRDEVLKVYDAASSAANDFYDGGDFDTSMSSKTAGLPGARFYTSDKSGYDFPVDYRIFVFDAQSSGGNTWNHGYSYGVVVSKRRNEVIYFAESW